jgi:hypothetical protein
MRASNLLAKSKIRSLIKTFMAIKPLQRGIRIIVMEVFFATPFSHISNYEMHRESSLRDPLTNSHIHATQTTLSREDR